MSEKLEWAHRLGEAFSTQQVDVLKTEATGPSMPGPAKHGVSGFMSFVVNQDGVIHEKNLGSDAAAAGLTLYDPGPTWRKALP